MNSALLPRKAKFVDSNGRSLLLAFPLDLIVELCQYLDSRELFRLRLSGSRILSRILLERGGICALRIFAEKLLSGSTTILLPPLSVLESLKLLTTVQIKLRPFQHIYSGFKISQLPPTITSLHFELAYPLAPFINWFIGPGSRHGSHLDLHANPAELYKAADHSPALWLQTASFLPKLRRLTVLGDMPRKRNYDAWLNTLPKETLQSLRVPFYFESTVYFPAIFRHCNSPELWTEVLPPNLTALRLAALPTGTLQFLPSTITILELPHDDLPIDILSRLTWLTELTCHQLTRDGRRSSNQSSNRSNFAELPRSLSKLSLSHTSHSPHELAHLPPSMTWLSICVPLHQVHLITAPLEYLSVFVRTPQLDWSTLPRTLRTLCFWHCADFSGIFGNPSAQYTNIPPHLTRLESYHSFEDAYIAYLPPTITKLAFRIWDARGAILPPNLTYIDQNVVTDSILRHPLIEASYIRKVRVRPLVYLPETATLLSCVSLSNAAFTYRGLPRGLQRLPATFIVKEDPHQHVSELPQSLTCITITGGLRMRSWLALPESVRTYRKSGGLYMIHEEVLECLAILRAEMDATEDEKTLVIPDDLKRISLRLHHKELSSRPYIRDAINALPTIAQWDHICYDTLPKSVTRLVFNLPKYEIERSLLQHFPRCYSPTFKLPDRIRSLVLGERFYNTLIKGVPRLPSPYDRIDEDTFNDASSITRCGLLVENFTATLTHLELNGKVVAPDLDCLEHCTSLVSLSLDYIMHQALGYATNMGAAEFRKIINGLPRSLQRLHILGYGAALRALVHTDPIEFPPLLTDLKILTSPSISTNKDLLLKDVLRLPHLTRLSLNLPDMTRYHFPSSITDLQLTQ